MSAAVRRVIVKLDAAAENRAAIETAARLAAGVRAPLHAVFVEDEDLLALASLSFAHHVTPHAGAERFATADAELHLRAAAERARREVAATARRHRVASAFEVVRGASAAAFSGANDQDLLVAAGRTRPVVAQFRTEQRWWAAAETAPAPFLIVRQQQQSGDGLAILLRDRGAASARLIAAAAHIARAQDGGTLTLIVPPALARSEDFAAWLDDHIAELGRSVRVSVEIAPAEPADLPQRVAELRCRALAIEADIIDGSTERLRHFVESFACDILIVR